MAGRSEYIIRYGGLPVGVHEFEFHVGSAFFKGIENSEIESANVNVNATLTKQNNVLQVAFIISGTVDVDCDRCLKSFGYPILSEGTLVVKHGKPEDSTDEILMIPEGDDEFDVSQYIYESIVLAMPARRVPCELDEKLYICDFETLAKLEKLSPPEEEAEDDNPMWEQLRKIKYNKN